MSDSSEEATMWEHEFEGRATQARTRRTQDAKADEGGHAGRALAALAAGRRVTAAAVHHLQRAAGNAAVGELLEQERSPVTEVVGKGGGQPLDQATKAFMESRMGSDFSDVRVHTDSKAAESARSVQAHAYTVGTDIVFDSGRYDPNSDAGRLMLAHELTHVDQQKETEVDGTPASGGISISDPSDRFERAAEANAARVMASGPALTSAGAVGATPLAASPAVQRLGEADAIGADDLGPVSLQRDEDEETEWEDGQTEGA
jgi:Domain of unknown function (DUF4157)